MTKGDIDQYAKQYSAGVDSVYSPWKNHYIGMAKKTVIKQVLKYAPVKADFPNCVYSSNKYEKTADSEESTVYNGCGGRI